MIHSPVIPFGTGNGKTPIIGSPRKSITIVIYTEQYYLGLGTSGRMTVNTVYIPSAATARPSDDTSYIRTVSIICVDFAVKEDVVHVYICIGRMSDDTTCMGA